MSHEASAASNLDWVLDAACALDRLRLGSDGGVVELGLARVADLDGPLSDRCCHHAQEHQSRRVSSVRPSRNWKDERRANREMGAGIISPSTIPRLCIW